MVSGFSRTAPGESNRMNAGCGPIGTRLARASEEELAVRSSPRHEATDLFGRLSTGTRPMANVRPSGETSKLVSAGHLERQ